MKRLNRLSTIFENEDEILVIASQNMIDKLRKEIEAIPISLSGFFDDPMKKKVIGVRHRATDFYFISRDDVYEDVFLESIKNIEE
jgi:hypothetical protein